MWHSGNNLSQGLSQRLRSHRVAVMGMVLAAALLPLTVVVAVNPTKIGRIIVDVFTEENIHISQTSFAFNLKPGECEEDSVEISNTANVSADVLLDINIIPGGFDDFDFQMAPNHDLDANSSVDVNLTGCLHPSAVIRDYRVDIDVLR